MIEKIGNRYRYLTELGAYLYANSKEELLRKIAILENMKKKWFCNRAKSKLGKASIKLLVFFFV